MASLEDLFSRVTLDYLSDKRNNCHEILNKFGNISTGWKALYALDPQDTNKVYCICPICFEKAQNVRFISTWHKHPYLTKEEQQILLLNNQAQHFKRYHKSNFCAKAKRQDLLLKDVRQKIQLEEAKQLVVSESPEFTKVANNYPLIKVKFNLNIFFSWQ